MTAIILLIVLEFLIVFAALYLFVRLIKEDKEILNAHQNKIQRNMDGNDIPGEGVDIQWSEQPFVELY